MNELRIKAILNCLDHFTDFTIPSLGNDKNIRVWICILEKKESVNISGLDPENKAKNIVGSKSLIWQESQGSSFIHVILIKNCMSVDNTIPEYLSLTKLS